MELLTDSMAAIVRTSLEHLYLDGEGKKDNNFDLAKIKCQGQPLSDASNRLTLCFALYWTFWVLLLLIPALLMQELASQGHSKEGIKWPFISWTVFMSLYESSPCRVPTQYLLLWGQDHLTQHGVHWKFSHPAANLNTKTWDKTSISPLNQEFNVRKKLKLQKLSLKR